MNEYDAHPAAGREWGFSLLETLIALTVAAVLAGLGIPAFGKLMRSNALEAEADLLLTDLHLARNHAVVHATRLMVCPRRGDGACGNAEHWKNGWLVFEDRDKDRALDAGETVLRERRVTADVSLDFRGVQQYAYFKTDGRAWPNATFRFCPRAADVEMAAVTLSMSGRPRLSSRDEIRASLDRGEPRYRCP